MAAAVLGASAPPREPVGPDRPAPISTFLFDLALIPGTAFLWGSARQRRAPAGTRASSATGKLGKSRNLLSFRPSPEHVVPRARPASACDAFRPSLPPAAPA